MTKRPVKAFISYSHRDKSMLDRLHTHLAMLRRDGGVAEWQDREIKAGSALDREIEVALQNCDVFLALVSADYLDSRYCYEKELGIAIARHDAGLMRVVPIIVEPCDWQSSPLQTFKALPQDGKPVSEWTNENNAWLDVVTELRRLISEHESETAQAEGAALASRTNLASRYRIKKTFDKIDRDDFRREAYETIRSYFESAVAELNRIEDIRGRYEAMSQAAFTCTVLNRLVKGGSGDEAHITVRTGARTLFGAAFGDISYCFAPAADDNTSHGGFSVDADSYRLFLKSNDFGSSARDRVLSPREAAEILWFQFIEQAGISYD